MPTCRALTRNGWDFRGPFCDARDSFAQVLDREQERHPRRPDVSPMWSWKTVVMDSDTFKNMGLGFLLHSAV